MSDAALACTSFYLLLWLPSIDICTENLVSNAYLSSWLPLSVCLLIKICHETFLSQQLFRHIYRKYKMSMSENFRSNGILSVAEMPFMQPVEKKKTTNQPLFWAQFYLTIWYTKFLGGVTNRIFASLWLPVSVISQVGNHFTEKQANTLCGTAPIWAPGICPCVLFLGGVGGDTQLTKIVLLKFSRYKLPKLSSVEIPLQN